MIGSPCLMAICPYTCWSSPHVCWLTPHTGRIPIFRWSNHVKSSFVDCKKKVRNVHLEMPWPVQFSHRTLRLAALGILKMGQTCFWGGNFCHVSQKNNLFFDVRYLHYTSNNHQHKHRTFYRNCQ